MLIALDVGNTNIVMGVFEKDKLLHSWRISSDKTKTSDEFGLKIKEILKVSKIKNEEIDDIIIASVVPDLIYTLSSACKRFLHKEPIVVGNKTKTGMNIKYENPKEVGADRIVNAVAGYEKYGGPLIIVDIGTAITHDVINEKGEYLGGAIAPGISISSEALFMRTSKLPKVELILPEHAVGKTTAQSMQSGIVFGFIGMIDYLVEKIVDDMNWRIEDVNIIATGGFSNLIAGNSQYIEKVDKNITLEGLRIIYNRSKK